MDNTFKSPNVLSLCPGFLGLERGLERVLGRVNIVAHVEIEAFIIENLVAAMEQGVLAPAPIWSNVKTFDGRPFRDKICGIVGGYPCQPFSNAGARNGTADPRHLYPYISGIIEATRPVWCFFENVEGHLTLGYDSVYQDLESMGYDVEAGPFTASEVGAPQERSRIFILAIRRDYKLGNPGLFRQALGQITTTGFKQCSEEGSQLDNPHSLRCNTQRLPDRQHDGDNTGTADEQLLPGEWVEYAHLFRPIEELGNTTSQGQQEPGPGIQQQLQEESGAALLNRPEQSSTNELADANGSRGEQDRQQSEFRTGGIEQSPGDSGHADTGKDSEGGCDRWPARPGQPQHEWEEPRTIGYTHRLPSSIRKLWHSLRPHFAKAMGEEVWSETDRNIKAAIEPGMGCTVDGYNFREDLLRAYGNSVVEQTAELAFRTLLDKHFPTASSSTSTQ